LDADHPEYGVLIPCRNTRASLLEGRKPLDVAVVDVPENSEPF